VFIRWPLIRTFQIKTGAPCRSERLAKYNQVKDDNTCSALMFLLLYM
jgi:hypothetical protein